MRINRRRCGPRFGRRHWFNGNGTINRFLSRRRRPTLGRARFFGWGSRQGFWLSLLDHVLRREKFPLRADRRLVGRRLGALARIHIRICRVIGVAAAASLAFLGREPFVWINKPVVVLISPPL